MVAPDPAIWPVLEYVYLSGREGPEMRSEEQFNVLGTSFRCVLRFGCGAVGHHAFMNPGA